MKRVLVITYYWPPTGGSGVQRWVKFIKYLHLEGWESVVYTPENPERTSYDETLIDDVYHGLEIIRRPIREPYQIYRRIMGKCASTDIKTMVKNFAAADGDVVTPISSGRKSFKQRLSLWIRANLFVPDPRVGWVRPSVRFLKKYLKDHPVDAIVTTGPPQSMHLIGQRLHRALGIPWIADFRDPWTKMYYLRHLPLTKRSWRRLHEMEESVAREASAVLTVTPMVQEYFKGLTDRPVAMITNGFDDIDFLGNLFPAPDGRFNLVHTGLFAADGNPLVLWKVLGEMAAESEDFKKQLRLRFAGKVDKEVMDSIREAGIGDAVVNLGYCNHKKAIWEQCAASLLLLPLRNDPEYRVILPGKLFEYLASKKPILGIGQEDGATAAVLKETEAGVMADWDNEKAIREFIELIWNKFDGGRRYVQWETKNIDRYTRRSLTAELAKLLDSVTINNKLVP